MQEVMGIETVVRKIDNLLREFLNNQDDAREAIECGARCKSTVLLSLSRADTKLYGRCTDTAAVLHCDFGQSKSWTSLTMSGWLAMLWIW